MKARRIPTSHIRQVMRFNKPMHSAQGMAIYGNLIFQLFHTGVCAVYNLESRSPEPLTVFPLGSFNDGSDCMDYANHANQCLFLQKKEAGQELPLMYITVGYGTGSDEDGFFYRCSVEQLHLKRDGEGRILGGSSEVLQTISYKDNGTHSTAHKSPCWGCPSWLVGSEGSSIYIFSAGYRTTEEFLAYRDVNSYRITRFSLPSPYKERKVIFTEKDIKDQFTTPFDILFTQAGTIFNNKLIYTFGRGDEQYPNGIRVYDLDKKCEHACMDLSSCIFREEEIESCSIFNGELFCNTNANPTGGIYSLGSIGDLI